ncbi:MAG: hypothetical protein JNM18_20930 [Planctomycetaceae bacterium]|nr:hypothetical protein [Planctomycetaceae bacterium]
MASRFLTPIVWALLISASFAADAPRGYHASHPVSAPTRLDAVFPLANQSLAEPPADWYPGYDSTAQKYELYAPAKIDRKKTYPVVLFISAGPSPAGWNNWKQLCEQQQIIFASPFAAGNNTPMPQRVRIVLDVLDDLRRQYPIDPDRTYLSGFSGGARVACGIAFALPELFGGVMPVCASESLREESWLRQRAMDRLSIALITGETDFNRGEIERWRGPLLAEVGVRSQVFVVDGMGHGIPPENALAMAYKWLEEGTAKRKQLAKQWPAMSLPATANVDRDKAAAALFAEAQRRAQQKATLYSGLMQMVGVMTRWPDTEAGREAKTLLEKYEAKEDRPWEADDLAEQRKFLAAEAKTLTAYATGPLPDQYEKLRGNMAAAALERWTTILADTPNTPLGKQAPAQIAELEKIADKK